MPTVAELAQQELQKRYSLQGRTQVAPRVQTMRNDPSVRSALSNLMRDAVDATGLTGGYRQGLLNAAGDIESAVDFVPVAGDVLALEDAARAYGQGDMVGAGINMLGVVPIVGDVLAKGAKPLSSLRTIPQFGEVIQTAKAGDVNEYPVRDFLNEKGYSMNPLMAEVSQDIRPDNIAKGSYKNLLSEYNNNPIIKQRENARLLGGRVLSPDDLFVQEGTYEQLLGSPLIALPADKTIFGTVDRVAGVDIDPYTVEGGPQHFDRYGNWMSMSGAAKSKQAHANRVRAETKKDPVYVYMGMDNYGSNFAEPASVIASRYIKSIGGLTKKGEDILNRQMQSQLNKGDTKGIAESWKGYTTPEDLEEWLKTTDEYATAGNKRKAFMSVLTNRELQAEGGPIPEDIYSIINEQAMLDNPAGFSGSRVMVAADADPLTMEKNTGLNASYDTIIQGEGGAVINQPMLPWNVMFPDPAAARANKQGPYRSFQTSGGEKDYQMADERWLQGVNKYLSSLRDI